VRTPKTVLVFGALMALAACNGGDEAPAVSSTSAPVETVVSTTTIAPSVSTRLGVTTTTARPAAPTTTVAPAPPTTQPAPTTSTTAFVVGGPSDPFGPVLCPGLLHPAHHRPCPTPRTQAVAEPTLVVATGPTPSAALAKIVECEDNDNPNAGPTGYASNTGNGYYGGYQWLPSTFNTALAQALKQGKVDQETYDEWYGVRPDKVPSWVQDAAAAAHIAAGGRGAWPNC